MDRLSEWVVGGAIFAVIFLLSRRLWLWYFKFDKMEKHLTEIAAALKPPTASARNAERR